jgi:hypothetical protein
VWPLKTNKEIDGTLGEGRKNGVRSWKRSKSRSRKRFFFPLLISSTRFVVAIGYGGRVPSKATQ